MTQPACTYPEGARYDGKGDSRRAEGLRAVLQLGMPQSTLCEVAFLEEKSTWLHHLGVQQLENRFSDAEYNSARLRDNLLSLLVTLKTAAPGRSV